MHINRLAVMSLLHFIAMYILMYAMVNTWDNIYPSLNNFYMAAVMTAPMLIIEVFLMGSMYEQKNALRAVGAIGVFVLFLAFLFIRQQSFIEDKEFIRSMIPHHSGAILMCERSQINDSELRQLCSQIISSQQEEIDQMERILGRLE